MSPTPTHAVLLLVVATVNTLPSAFATQAYDTELSNVRALPFGFHAVCEQTTLKFRSSSSASFVIRNSVLCQLRAAELPIAERDLFTLCSNDPHQSIDKNNRAIPKCAELSIEFQEI